MVAQRSAATVALVLALLVGSAAAQAPGSTAWSIITAINCGGQAIPAATSSDGIDYVADAYFSPSSLAWSRPVALPDQHRTLRYAESGPLYYTVPVPVPGYYRVNLTWTELYQTGPNQRDLFVGVGADVVVQPNDWSAGLVMDDTTILDIWSLAGGSSMDAVSLVFPAPQTGTTELWATNTVSVVIFHVPSSQTGLPMLGTLQLLGQALPPTPTPASIPTMGPTTAPSATAAPVPSGSPVPTIPGTAAPSLMPSPSASVAPTMVPSPMPSTTSTMAPTTAPSMMPSMTPTTAPSMMPSMTPTTAPSMMPSMTPTTAPSMMPSMTPTMVPSTTPSAMPSTSSTAVPTMGPTPMPSPPPTGSPTGSSQYMTIHAERQTYTAAAFAMSLASVPVSFSSSSAGANSTIRAATVEQCPVMGMEDLGVSYYHVLLQSGTHHVPHQHPRASEGLFVTTGTVHVFFVEEGGDEATGPTTRLIQNTIAAGGVALFPRGLLHGVSCVSTSPCTYLSTHPHADPGVVLAGATICDGPIADVAAVLGVPQDEAAVVCAGMAPQLAASQPTT